MTQRQRLAYGAFVTAACGSSLLLLGSAWRAGPLLKWRPANILWWGIRDVLQGPAFLLLFFGIALVVRSKEVRRNPLSSVSLVLLLMAVYRCMIY